MRVMIFVDSDNFKGVRNLLKEENRGDRWIDFHKLNKFVLDYLEKNLQYKNCKLSHIRTYYYTGEYTSHLFKRIKEAIKESKTDEDKKKYEKELKKALKNHEGQKDFLKKSANYYFFEVRKKPLQFTKENMVFQKGVDVQLAVDLVSNAYLNNYDIAVLFSGDIDLIESVKSVKNLGKQVIIFSHYKNTSKEMRLFSDMFVDFQKLNDNLLDSFSHIFEKKVIP